MDKDIKEFLISNPGISANKIFSIYKEKNNGKKISVDTIFMRLRKLKRKGILVNQGNRWYINTRYEAKN